MNTERPIIFSGSSVRAILDGTKTQTRRLISERSLAIAASNAGGLDSVPGPYHVGVRLWVRETIRRCESPNEEILPNDLSEFAADGELTKADCWPWKTSVLSPIHCPRGLSRITLEITDVRVQRLQDITEADARAEGINPMHGPVDVVDCGNGHGYFDPAPTALWCFEQEWDAINRKRASWESNPWVWAISFRRLKPC